MEVRLGFSVAVHLEPDVLLIDEVLSVGRRGVPAPLPGADGRAPARGQTLVFISHVLADIRRLCPRVIYLNRGMVVMDGGADEVIDRYLADVAEGGRPPERI